MKTTLENLLSVKDIHGPITDLMTKFQGKDSKIWLKEFKKFLRKDSNFNSNSNIITLKQVIARLERAMISNNQFRHHAIDHSFVKNSVEFNVHKYLPFIESSRFELNNIVEKKTNKEIQSNNKIFKLDLLAGLIEAAILIENEVINIPETGVIIYLSDNYKYFGNDALIKVYYDSFDRINVDLVGATPESIWSNKYKVLCIK